MDYLIAPTLFQNKTCRLPGIGTLNVITHSAAADFIHAQIRAPFPAVVFAAAQEDENVFNEFTALSELIKKDLDEKGTVMLKGVGNFIKEADGTINFLSLPLSASFTPPVVAKRVIRQDAEHAMLVGDKQTTNTLMAEYFVEEGVVTKDRWWIWAIVLGVIGVAALVLYFVLYGFNVLGNMVPATFA